MFTSGATALITLAPRPPTPMTATFSFSLGGVSPLRANARRGTIAADATAAAAANCRREIRTFSFIDISR